MKKLFSLLFSAAFALSVGAQGYVEAIVDHTSSQNGLNQGTIGYTFRANADMSVSDIGVFAYILEATAPMRVGLWDAAGNLLADRTITVTSTQVGASRYETLPAPISLVGQQVYHLGVYFPTDWAFRIVGGDLGGTVTTSPGVTLIGYAANTTGFAFPTADPTGVGFFPITGNLLVPQVPEPSVGSLAVLGILSLAGFRKKLQA